MTAGMRTIFLSILIGASACAAHPKLSTTVQNAALVDYAQGGSFEEIAQKLHLADRFDARAAVHDGLLALSHRYYHDP